MELCCLVGLVFQPPIEVGENQELTIWGAVTYIIHQAR